MELREIYESKINLDEAEKGKPFLARIKFSFARSDIKNRNNRVYPHSVLAPQIEALNARLKKVRIAGQADHPKEFTELSRISHVLERLWMKDKTAWAQALLLDTNRGRDLLTLLKAIPIGASMRGYGKVSESGEVQPDYRLQTIDLVENPSFGDVARNIKIIESTLLNLEPSEDKLQLPLVVERLLSGRPAIWVPKRKKEKDDISDEIRGAFWYRLAGYRG